MNQNKKIYIFFTICFIISTFTFSITLSSLYPFYSEAVETNNFNSNFKTVNIETNEAEELGVVSKMIESVGVDDFLTLPMLHNIERGSTLYINKIIGCGSNFNVSEYLNITGDNFTNEDFIEGSKKAIVGRGLEKLIIEANNKRYIDIFGEEYEVIGFIEDSSMFLYSSFVPIYSLNFINNKYNKFTQLVRNESIDKLKTIDLEKYTVSANEIPQIDIIDFLLDKPIELKDRLFQLSICLINIMVFSYFFAKSTRKKISIMRVLGANNVIVFKEVFKNIVSSALIGTGLGLLLAQVAIMYMRTIDTYGYKSLTMPIAIYTVIIVLVLTVIISLLVLIDVLRFKVIKEVRR